MPTIDNKKIVDKLISNNGHYGVDAPVQSIVQYTNMWGGTSYGVNYSRDNEYEESPFVINPKTIFTRSEE